MTLASAFQALFAIWGIPALASVAVGVLGLSGHDPKLYSLSRSIQTGVSLLSLVTIGMLAYWFFRVRVNVVKLGTKPVIGITAVVLSTLKALFAIVPIVLATSFVPALGALAGLAVVGCLIYVASFAPRLLTRAAVMLWKSSASPGNPSVVLPSYAGMGIYGWYFSNVSLALHSQLIGVGPDLWSTGHSVTLILAGLFMGASAYGGGRLVLEVARRQESKLMLLGSIAHHKPDEKRVTVSENAVAQAWSDSESLIQHDYN